MSRDPDSWDDALGAEIYGDLVSAGRLYPAMADGLLELLAPSAGEVLLDLACGTGLLAERAGAVPAESPKVVGVDAAGAMLDVGRRRVPGGGAAFLLAHVGELPLAAGSCTAATCSAALWHFPGLRAALGEVSRVLRAGGRLAFNVPAAQLRDAKNLPPSPLQLALARAGERRFGREPDAAGPRLAAADLLAWCREAGLEPLNVRWRDYPVTQQELADLLSVPAFGARAYAEAEAEQRDAWVAEALSSVDPKRIVHVRWWEVLARR